VVQAGVYQVMNPDFIDQSVDPDLDEVPTVIETVEAKADHVHRICSAWDHGVHPEPELTRRPGRRLISDCPGPADDIDARSAALAPHGGGNARDQLWEKWFTARDSITSSNRSG
jgi:hypothetical protein